MSKDWRDPRRWRRTRVGKFLHGLGSSAPPWQCPFNFFVTRAKTTCCLVVHNDNATWSFMQNAIIRRTNCYSLLGLFKWNLWFPIYWSSFFFFFSFFALLHSKYMDWSVLQFCMASWSTRWEWSFAILFMHEYWHCHDLIVSLKVLVQISREINCF